MEPRMARHRRIKRAKKIIKNVRKFVTWCKRSKKRIRSKLHAINKKSGNLGKIHCYSCGEWIHKDWMWEHIQSHEKQRKQGGGKTQPQQQQKQQAQPQNTWGPWKRQPNQKSTVSTPVNPPQEQQPTKNPPKKQQTSNNRPKFTVVQGNQKSGGKQMPTTPKVGGDEGTDTPHAGNDEVSSWFSQWASRY